MAATNSTKPFYNTEIPSDWEICELGKLITLISGMHLNPEDYNNDGEGIPYFTGPTDYTNFLLEVKKWTIEKDTHAKKNDVLLTVKGSGVGGHFLLCLDKVAIGRQIMALRAKEKHHNKFIYYSLATKEYTFQELAKGNMIPGLTRSDILSIKILTPPLPEQKAIAQVLSTADAAIHTTSTLIAQKELRKKWLMQQLLTGKKRLKGFGGEWKEMHIRDVAKEVSIRNKSDKQLTVLSCTKYDGLVPSLEYFGRKIFADDVSTYKIVPKKHFAYATNHIEEGSIGYQEMFDEALISPMYTVFKTNGTVNDTFFYRLLKSHPLVYQYQNRMEGSIDRRGGLRWDGFSIIKINLPSYEEQTAIAQVLQAADKEISLLKAKAEKLREQKKGLMQLLLTGKVRFKID
jgi:type I restriction enzyme S subunit